MAKLIKDKKPSSQKDESKRTVKAVIVTGVIFAFYLALLLNPFTGAWFQYPYYRVFCGKKPVVGTAFMTKTYKTPEMKTYKVNGFQQQLFCTANEARAHGYSKSLAR